MSNAAVQTLFAELADLYSAENRPGGDAAASALRNAEIGDLPELTNPYAERLTQALSDSDHPICPSILAAMRFVQWGASDLRNGRIPDHIANQMPMCELLGPDGLSYHSEVRVGLWLQQPDLIYGPRRHEAEETFLIFSGHALWSTEDTPPTAKGNRIRCAPPLKYPTHVCHREIPGFCRLAMVWQYWF